jgi:hypothetical protein
MTNNIKIEVETKVVVYIGAQKYELTKLEAETLLFQLKTALNLNYYPVYPTHPTYPVITFSNANPTTTFGNSSATFVEPSNTFVNPTATCKSSILNG